MNLAQQYHNCLRKTYDTMPQSVQMWPLHVTTYQRQQHTNVAGIKVATPDSQLTVSPGRILAASAVRPGNKRNKILTYAT